MSLYDRLTDFDGRLLRNITSLRVSEDLFDDLVADGAGRAAALAADLRMRPARTGVVERGLHYSQAIGYPFTSDQTVASRYGDGSLRVWYGALEEATGLAETCWHQLRQLSAIEGVSRPVTRHRAVYEVHARGLFLELRGKERDHPELLDEDYGATQAIGKHASAQGLPGLLYPSARWPDGSCLAAFRAEPLSRPRLRYYLTYRIDAVAQTVTVERRPGVVETQLHLSELQRHR
ncbi:RES family NAD+ phosphorylase [Luteimonas sp. RD2P54]|uniref:RES family NAD+ phosphorylase n=1 Tax=Luteimonas endophytica TaxID=3042023 RepID=A0ABT6J738_9GAMM|nr:RES family NAD+ phosphorylase [Luteimonas endophytica]MDH5822559.1 RES family NAD+ phosphorylase [Luteimonas endophytica]